MSSIANTTASTAPVSSNSGAPLTEIQTRSPSGRKTPLRWSNSGAPVSRIRGNGSDSRSRGGSVEVDLVPLGIVEAEFVDPVARATEEVFGSTVGESQRSVAVDDGDSDRARVDDRLRERSLGVVTAIRAVAFDGQREAVRHVLDERDRLRVERPSRARVGGEDTPGVGWRSDGDRDSARDVPLEKRRSVDPIVGAEIGHDDGFRPLESDTG